MKYSQNFFLSCSWFSKTWSLETEFSQFSEALANAKLNDPLWKFCHFLQYTSTTSDVPQGMAAKTWMLALGSRVEILAGFQRQLLGH